MTPLFTGCWFWAKSTNRNGYGRMWRNKKTVLVHKVIYEAVHGPVGKGIVLDHLCRNRRCVRPDHLEAVSVRTNTLRGQAPTAKNWRRAR